MTFRNGTMSGSLTRTVGGGGGVAFVEALSNASLEAEDGVSCAVLVS